MTPYLEPITLSKQLNGRTAKTSIQTINIIAVKAKSCICQHIPGTPNILKQLMNSTVKSKTLGTSTQVKWQNIKS